MGNALPTIRTSFARITPESAEEGDHSETGWIDEEGKTFTADEESGTIVEQAIEWLQRDGACYASDSPTCHIDHTWYSAESECTRWWSGEHETRSFHLSGFTEADQLTIYKAITKRV